jgi:hypothetical protein
MKLITREIELKLKKNMALPEGERVPVLKFSAAALARG